LNAGIENSVSDFGRVSVEALDFAAAEELRSGRVSALLTQYEFPTPVIMHVVYSHARHLAAKVRVFVDFLAERFAKATPGRWEQSKSPP
jgi:hypothetical protein